MILIDAIYINNSGGKVLLDYLVEKTEVEKIDCFYLFDDRCKNDYKFIPDERKIFLKASLIKRHQFYLKNKLQFSKVLCFGNLPPTIKLQIPVITYFHQLLYLDVPKSFPLINKMKIYLKTFVLNRIKYNTNLWLVQTEPTKRRLAEKINIDLKFVELIPFYPPLNNDTIDYKRNKDGFVYISNGGIHKNHINLIEAFCSYFDDNQKGILHITISEKFPELLKLIKFKNDQGYPIVNHGFINRDDLAKIYRTNKFIIFPSLAESFGLGLVEAIENGCKVIGSDLPYTYAVCNPSIVFDPLDINDIKRALIESQANNIKRTEQIVFNQIDELIALLKE